MSNSEISKATIRYHFLVDLLDKINSKTSKAFISDIRWFAYGPKVCAKFLSQAKTLILLFSEKYLEFEGGESEKYEDISTIYSIIRMQFETHALFYHLFVPSENWEINILRFRLWELDGLRHIISMAPTMSSDYETYKIEVEKIICQIPYFKQLDTKIQQHLIKKAQWRFTSDSIRENYRLPISYETLIKNTQIKKSVYSDLYIHFSTYIHPTYWGIIDNHRLTETNLKFDKLSPILYASFVTAFLIEDMAKRFIEGKEVLNTLNPSELDTYWSMILHGRYN